MEPNVKMLNPVTLAFMGDSVFEMLVRQYLIEKYGSMSPGKLHAMAVLFVKASSQAKIIKAIMPSLTDDEVAVFKRGRNYKGVHAPKNADAAEYRYATGFEALMGYLHLSGRNERISEIFEMIKPMGFENEYREIV